MTTKAIRELLARRREAAEQDEAPDRSFEREDVAAAALMVECARIDGEFAEEERAAIRRALRERLNLDAAVADCLVAVAERRTDEVWHDWLFTATIKASFGSEEQLAVIERMWEVALADGKIAAVEEHLIMRIGEELGVAEAALVESRERARKRAARGAETS